MFSIVGNKSAMSSRNKSTIVASNMSFLGSCSPSLQLFGYDDAERVIARTARGILIMFQVGK